MKAILFAVLLLIAVSASAEAATYYVSLTGSNTNSGSITAPWRTCVKALNTMVGGDILFLRGGEYKRADCDLDQNTIPSGTGPTNRTVISAMPVNRTCSGYNHNLPGVIDCYNSTYEKVTLKPSGVIVQGPKEWIVIEGLIVDKAKLANSSGMAFRNTGAIPTNYPACDNHSGSYANGPRDIYALNNTLRNGTSSGFSTKHYQQRIHLFHNDVQNFGTREITNHHGAYWAVKDGVVHGNTFANNGFFGAQFYTGQQVTTDDPPTCFEAITGMLVEANRFFGNYDGVYNGGAVVGTTFRNNLVYDNVTFGVTVNSFRAGPAHKVYNNTIVDNGRTGLRILDRGDNAIIKNNIYGGLFVDGAATGVVFENNYNACSTCARPAFVGAEEGDYRLVEGDPRINAGQNLTSVGVTTDFDGNTRPKGGAFDIGAFEFDSAGQVETFDYLLSVDEVIEEEEVTIDKGGTSIPVLVSVSRLLGTAGLVTFSASNLPSGVTATFDPTSCTPSPVCTSNLILTSTHSTPEGNFAITLRGTSGSLTRTVELDLIVKCRQPSDDVADVMNSVATYAYGQYSPSQSAVWNRGVLHAGLAAHARATGSTNSRDRVETFGTHNNWVLSTGGVVPDRLMAGSVWIDAYHRTPTAIKIADTRTIVQGQTTEAFPGTIANAYAFVDAIFMGVPTFVRMAQIDSDQTYRDRAFALFSHIHTTEALYDATDHLFYRDDSYIGVDSPNLLKVLWSRGNGWAYYGLARILDELPLTDPNRAAYLTTFTEMSAALIAIQRTDGFWNMNLADPDHFGGPETSGTALFTAGMAWGVRKGILANQTYLPIVKKAWNGLSTIAVQPDGRVGYVQNIGGQPVSGVDINASTDFGVGVVLLAGKEMYQLLGGSLQ